MCKKFLLASRMEMRKILLTRSRIARWGEIDDLYEFLEESGCHYVSLLACAAVPDKDSDDLAGSRKPKLFNEAYGLVVTWCRRMPTLPAMKNKRCLVLQEMFSIVSDQHRSALKIDSSQEMMVGLAFAMPFEIRQFELFHVYWHIDTTAN